MLNIALFGPPGAGKGTQSKMLAARYNLTYISTGDLLREEIAAGTELGLKAKDVIDKGGLTSDELIVEIIEHRIRMNPNSNGILFDGFPRTVVQAYILDGLMQRMRTELMCMLSLEVPREELLTRLHERSKVSGRSDDNEEVIQNRLKEYNEKTLPVANYYKQKGIYVPIEGVGKVEEIFERITSVIDAKSNSSRTLLNVVLCGFPGSGKRSHSLLIEEKYGLVPISTGRLLREEIEKQTEIGKIAKPIVERGDNIPDEIAIRLIEEKMRQYTNAKGFVFKGFPGNYVQAYILDGLLRKIGSTVTCAINFQSSSIQCIKRLAKRGKTKDARPYDLDPEVIIHRLETYEENAAKILGYYEKQNILYNVKDVNDTSISFQEVCKHIDNSSKRILK